MCSKYSVTPVVITTQLAWVDLSGIPLSMSFKITLFYSRRIFFGPKYMHNAIQCLEMHFCITSWAKKYFIRVNMNESAFHRIIEWFGEETSLKIFLFQPYFHKQGCHPLDQVGQSPTHTTLEYFQSRGHPQPLWEACSSASLSSE